MQEEHKNELDIRNESSVNKDALSRKFKKLKHHISYLNMEHEEILEIFDFARQKFISSMFEYCSENNKKSPFSQSKEEKNERQKNPEQLKELYREIVKNTHPDKTKNLSEEEINTRAELYHEATTGKLSGDFNKILKVAIELDIEIESINEELIEMLSNEIDKVETKISTIKKDIMYRWYYSDPDQQKSIFDQITSNQ